MNEMHQDTEDMRNGLDLPAGPGWLEYWLLVSLVVMGIVLICSWARSVDRTLRDMAHQRQLGPNNALRQTMEFYSNVLTSPLPREGLEIYTK